MPRVASFFSSAGFRAPAPRAARRQWARSPGTGSPCSSPRSVQPEHERGTVPCRSDHVASTPGWWAARWATRASRSSPSGRPGRARSGSRPRPASGVRTRASTASVTARAEGDHRRKCTSSRVSAARADAQPWTSAPRRPAPATRRRHAPRRPRRAPRRRPRGRTPRPSCALRAGTRQQHHARRAGVRDRPFEVTRRGSAPRGSGPATTAPAGGVPGGEGGRGGAHRHAPPLPAVGTVVQGRPARVHPARSRTRTCSRRPTASGGDRSGRLVGVDVHVPPRRPRRPPPPSRPARPCAAGAPRRCRAAAPSPARSSLTSSMTSYAPPEGSTRRGGARPRGQPVERDVAPAARVADRPGQGIQDDQQRAGPGVQHPGRTQHGVQRRCSVRGRAGPPRPPRSAPSARSAPAWPRSSPPPPDVGQREHRALLRLHGRLTGGPRGTASA